MSEFIKVASLSDVKEGKLKKVDVDGDEICLINSAGKIYALDNLCPHQDGPINEGYIEDGEVVCPWHQAKFDIKTGKANKDTDWADVDLKSYEVKVEGDDILVKI